MGKRARLLQVLSRIVWSLRIWALLMELREEFGCSTLLCLGYLKPWWRWSSERQSRVCTSSDTSNLEVWKIFVCCRSPRLSSGIVNARLIVADLRLALRSILICKLQLGECGVAKIQMFPKFMIYNNLNCLFVFLTVRIQLTSSFTGLKISPLIRMLP